MKKLILITVLIITIMSCKKEEYYCSCEIYSSVYSESKDKLETVLYYKMNPELSGKEGVCRSSGIDKAQEMNIKYAESAPPGSNQKAYYIGEYKIIIK